MPKGNAPVPVVDPEKLRRIALANQGLLQKQPFGRGLSATQRAIKHLGYLQIDTISVVARAHNHVMQSRVPNYNQQHIHRLLQNREIFEARFPVAAFRPMDEFRFTLPHARKWRSRKLSREDRATMRRVLQRVRSEGPLRSRDFEDARDRSKGWWDWKPAKRALEQLFFQGDLMISARDGFQKSYDLTERVLPSSVAVSEPTLAEFSNYLIDSTLRAHGFASYKSMAAGARFGAPVAGALRAELKRRCESGQLIQISNGNGSLLWLAPDMLDAPTPRVAKRAKLLSPFDNAVTQRERMLDIFGFDYQIECFVPEAKRKYGYYCLPILYADRLIGRVDCKSYRDKSLFEVKALFLEPEFASRNRAAEISDPLAHALTDYAGFDGCDEVTVTLAKPAFAGQLLRKSFSKLHSQQGEPS